jgi:hypothetical protein
MYVGEPRSQGAFIAGRFKERLRELLQGTEWQEAQVRGIRLLLE